MTHSFERLAECESRLRLLLPETYRDSYEKVEPVSMGSAGLRYDDSGKVAWNEMWGSFCDLAMAGGPPHKGALLEPAGPTEVAAQPQRYKEVVEEICRGIHLVTGLHAHAARLPGWIRLDCTSAAMSAWLLRAITMENVAVRSEGLALGLPAGPAYRVEKKIKNVITVVAKTCHYWMEHMSEEQHDDVGELLRTLQMEKPLLVPAKPEDGDYAQSFEVRARATRDALARVTGLEVHVATAPGWVGLECPNVRSAVWTMRMLVGCNVLARREGTTLLVPVSAGSLEASEALISRVEAVIGWARSSGMMLPTRENSAI